MPPDVLASIEHDDGDEAGDGAGGPVAIGVLPFLPDSPAELVIPSAVVRKRADGTAWVTLIDDAERPLPRSPAHPAAASYDIRPAVDVAHYLHAVESARDAVRSGDIVKAVIARPITVTSDHPIDVHAVLGRLRASFGSSYRFSVDGFIGASPELLVAVEGDVIRSHPLAGTAPITGDVDNDARSGVGADRQHQEPGRAPHRDRDGARHAAAVVQLPRLGAGAVDREGRERAAPRFECRGPPVEPGSERARAGAGVVADPCRRRPPAIARRSS